MNAYELKSILYQPYILYMRYRERHQQASMKNTLELHHYRPSFYGFVGATLENPDILYDAPISRGDVVMDVGAYVGNWTARIHEKYGAKVYLFEPEPGFARKLSTRFADNEDVQCFSYGLGREDSELVLLKKHMGSTLYSGAAADAKDTVVVPVRDIVGVLDELGLEEVDLLKLNIEGGEYDVLERLIESGRINQVRCLMVQFHEWLDKAQVRRRRIRRALRKTHNQNWNYTFIWEMWTRR